MLDILEKFLIRKGYCFSRLDGSTPTGSRQSLVENFNSSPSKQVFLISTRAGGLGLNLVSANRVVIFDPNWNPAHDLQAQDRSFRFGQKRHVIVFRFLAAGSLEELVYTRQVYKQQLANIAVSGRMEKRYFEGVQDCKEFQGELFGICNLFRDLSDKLFTSEIIDLHEKQEKECGNGQNAKQELAEPGTTTSEPERNEMMMAKPVLQDLGIVYAHRYEDIVNIGHETQGEKNSSNHNEEEEDWYQSSECGGRSANEEWGEMSACAKKRKKRQYSLLARSLGMGDVEFSKWLLSATPADREKVLLRFKKGKT